MNKFKAGDEVYLIGGENKKHVIEQVKDGLVLIGDSCYWDTNFDFWHNRPENFAFFLDKYKKNMYYDNESHVWRKDMSKDVEREKGLDSVLLSIEHKADALGIWNARRSGEFSGNALQNWISDPEVQRIGEKLKEGYNKINLVSKHKTIKL